jgi:orotidine 5'-phosphate decarboxylase subfamily 1
MRLTFSKRAERQHNPIGKKLFLLMEKKQSNLAISADVTSKKELIEIADQLGSKICILKTHIDIIEDADLELTQTLKTLAEKHHFLIFEDRKFADIGNTVKLQYEAGPFKISSWADMVNFHLISGPGILDGLTSAKGKSERGFIVLSQMSSTGNLLTPEYTQKTLELAEKNPDDVFGFICQNKISNDTRFIHMTPGVNLETGSDHLGQQYRTPEKAIIEEGCDIIIVGRGIIASPNKIEMTEQYRLAAWNAYTKSLDL